jgi:two-component system, NtrC family, response regulator HydG
MPWITIIDGSGTTRRYELSETRTTIGRDATNHVQIADLKASRVHAEITRVSGRFHVRDLDSSNGTWHDDGRINSLPLSDGSLFRIGTTTFRFDSKVAQKVAQENEWPDPDHIQGLEQKETQLFTTDNDVDTRTLLRTNAYLVLLHQLIKRSHAATSRDALFELLDDAAAEILEGDRCAVFLPSPDEAMCGWMLWPTHERRLRARFGAVPFARTLLSAVRTQKAPLLCTSDGDLAPSASMMQAGVQSAMAAPVRVGDEIHALLYVDRLAATAPFSRPELEFLAAVANQLAVQLSNRQNVANLTAEVSRLQAEPRPKQVAMLGEDPAIKNIQTLIERIARAETPVLIQGESGTGKELIARLIHERSTCAERPFQVITCGGIDPASSETILFGSAKPGEAATPGIFELADRATIFIDELADVSPAVQARLLRVMESGEIQRVGDGALRRVNVRLIVATNRDLREEIAAGRVRSDVVRYLEVMTLITPPLRSRPADIDILMDHFLRDHAERHTQPLKRLAADSRALMLRYDWPGNVRQLRNVIERVCTLATDRIIQPSDLPEMIRGAEVSAFQTSITSLAVVERAHILRVLEHCGGNKKAAAELLEIDRSTLYAKLRQYGVM